MPEEKKYFDKMMLHDGSYAEVYDPVCRAAIQGGTYFLGITSTPLEDGSTTNPINIISEENGETIHTPVTAVNGNMAAYENSEFVFTSADNKWHLLGDLTNLGDLALKDNVSATYTPNGSVTAPGVSVALDKTIVNDMYSGGSVTPGEANVPTAVTLPVLSATMNGDVLEIVYTDGSVSPGQAGKPTEVILPTTQQVQVVVGVSAALDGDPQFSGEQATIVSD